MSFSLLPDFGLLGMNARNLDYVRPLNRKKAVKMADNKLATKHFLSTRDIPVPRLISSIKNRKELEALDFAALPESFVIKPNAGFGGEGIIVVTRHTQAGFEKVSGSEITREELYDHIADILDGRYSLGAMPDIAIVEQRVETVEYIPGLSVAGLPDLRVIVYNMVPVMAMLRVPTPESDGKANVHLGGYGFGIDVARGETTYATQYNKLLTRLPGDIPTAGHAVPHWDEILHIATRAQLLTNLGYLAADIVVDKKDGPVLLEVNSRAGLMVQVANRAGLKARLERVKGLRVDTPDKGVALAKELFGTRAQQRDKKQEHKTVVRYIEPAELILDEGTQRVRVELDPTHETTAVDAALAERLALPSVTEGGQAVHLRVRVADRRIATVAQPVDLADADYKVILGRRDLSGFLIDPTPLEKSSLPKLADGAPTKKGPDYTALDTQLAAIDGKIKLLAHLKPLNMAAEEKKFRTKKGDYNPQFRYPETKFDVAALRAELTKIEIPTSEPLGQLLAGKQNEIARKIALVAAVGTDDFSAASQALYGLPTDAAIVAAEERLSAMPRRFARDPATIDATEAVKRFDQALAHYGLSSWKAKLRQNMAADALANKKGSVFVRSGAVFAPDRLRGTIAHEIGTHVLRAANGATQPYEVLARGTAGYLQTEEGLAVWGQEQVMKKDNPKHYWPALSLLATNVAQSHSFAEVFQFIREAGFDLDRAWKTALKVKRGLADTGTPGGFTKEHVYFSGFLEIGAFLDTGYDVRDLFVGKITIADLPLVRQLPGLKKPTYLPTHLS